MAMSSTHAVDGPKERRSESAATLLETAALYGPLSAQAARGWEIIENGLAGMHSLIFDQLATRSH